ncbi:MAG: hypothetical protein FWH17_04435 [Oscillospiraceae bacterium]|nr:hypothetical protein [Oscillospiraceae bacterium]
MKKQIIFYGAGQNAQNHFADWNSRGIIPVCFADADETKHYTKFQLSDIDILPLDAAIANWPVHEIYITPTREKYAGIVSELIARGIKRKAIKFFEPVEYRKGCHNMGHYFILTDNKIGVCCVPEFMKRLEFEASPDPKVNFRRYEEQAREIIDNWRHNRPSVCDGCPNLEFGYWDIEPAITVLNISSKYGADFCNTKCIYCSHFPKPEQAEYERRGHEVIDMLKAAREVYPDRSFRVDVAAGEIAVAPFRDKLFYNFQCHSQV